MQPTTIRYRPLDQLEDEIISLSHRINASEYEFLVLVREFDLRQGWRAYHFNSCAEWLNMRCGMSLGTAREKVRVANDLFSLPLCSTAFADGNLSYSKARALTRMADARNERELLDYALLATASQVEEHCRQLRNAQRRVSTADANRLHNARYLSRSYLEDGSMTIRAELPREQGELVMKAIELAMAWEFEDSGDERSNKADSFFARQADGLVAMARQVLSGKSASISSSSDNYQVVVHVDESALKDEGGKSDLPIESVRRISCDSDLVEVTQDKKGNLLNLGRKHRVVSPQLKRALLARDRVCRYPTCTHDKWLSAHHVVHWSDGGETSLDNCLLICSAHHRLLHEGEFTIHKNFEGQWYFRNGDGKVIPEAPTYVPADENASRDAFDDNVYVIENDPPDGVDPVEFACLPDIIDTIEDHEDSSIREPVARYALG